MKNIEDIVVILFARLNSQRIPKKMIKPFAGTTLIDIAISKILSSQIVSKENIFLFVHERELLDIGRKQGINILQRSKNSANAESDVKEIHEWRNKLNYKYVISFNACVPFLRIETIDDFILHYINSPHFGLFGVVKNRNYIWDKSGNPLTAPPKDKQTPNTKTAPIYFEAAHCLYASKIEWLDKGIWLGSFTKLNDPELYIVEESEVFDIDYPWQFEMAESLYDRLNI
jgi:CMP-N-acetylneuraminic acid synthetase